MTLEQYIGVDIIPELIARNQSLYGNERTRFVLLDLTRDELPRVDVILSRLFHSLLLPSDKHVSRVASERKHSHR